MYLPFLATLPEPGRTVDIRDTNPFESVSEMRESLAIMA
jgi:hypothetical protein